MSETHSGTCFCEAVDVEIIGEALEMGYCHCTSCRWHSGAPLSAFALYKRDSVKITRGEEFVQHFNKTGMSDRYFCRRCGGNVMVNHPGLGLSHIHPANFPTLIFKPTVHLNYVERILPIRDGLPKLKDFPAEAGGSGDYVSE